MSYPARIPLGTERKQSKNTIAKKGGRDDMSGKLKGDGKGKKATGYSGAKKSVNTDKAAHNRKGNSLVGIHGARGVTRNKDIKTGEITNVSASTVKKIG